MKHPAVFSLSAWIVLSLSALWGPLAVSGTANPEEVQKLFATKALSPRNLQDGSRYIDFTQLMDPGFSDREGVDPFLGMVSNGLELLKDYLQSSAANADSLAINDLVGSFLGEDGFVEFEIDGGFFLDLGVGTAVNLTSVSVGGLDSFREADLFRPTGAASPFNGSPETTLQNSFVLDTLILDLYLTETNGNSKEPVTIRLPFSGVAVSTMPLVLAVSEEGLENFPLGAILDLDHLLPCLGETVVDDAGLLALEATFEKIGNPELLASSTGQSGFLDVVKFLFVNLPASVPIFFNTTVRSLLNDVLTNNLVDRDDQDFEGEPCPSYPESTDATESRQDLIDFPSFFDQGVPALLMGLLEDQLLAVDPDTGLPKINDVLIAPMIEGMGDDQMDGSDTETGASLVFGSGEEGLVNANTSFAIGGLAADVQLRLSDVELYNLDTMIPPLQLLEPLPQQAQQLNNTMTMGLNLDDPRSMGLAAKIFLAIDADDNGSIEHNLRIQANMETLSLVLTALLEVVESRLYGFPIKDITNLQCWLATILAPSLDDRTGIRLESEDFTAGIAALEAAMARMNLDVKCIGVEGASGSECDSPGIEDWINLLTTPKAQEGATESMNSILDWAASLLSGGGAILQTPIDRMLNDASIQCPHSPDYNPDAVLSVSYESAESLPENEYSYEYLILWGSIAVALVLALALMAIGVRCSVRRKHRRLIASNDISNEERRRIALRQQEEEDFEQKMNAATRSMFGSPEIPLLIRWGMPLVVLGNIALFLSGHLNLGATVYIEANLAGEQIKVEDFFDFAIARSTIDIWRAGGKSLAILILIFSGIWPYTKQLLTLGLWFLPTSMMSISTRGKFWIWLDRLAKWSMIDIFVIVVCIAAFRVSITSPDVAFLPEDFYSVDLLVVPMWGLYSNMTAQLVSQVSSHFIIYYHRCIVKKATEKLQPTSPSGLKPEILRIHTFSNPHFESGEKLVAKRWVGPFVIILSIILAALVCFGSIVSSFSVEILGIIGVAVESGQKFKEAVTPHGVFSIVIMLIEEAQFINSVGDYIGIGVLTGVFVLTIIAVPILQALVLLYQWFVSLTLNQRRRLLVVNEILQAWQYIEVYLIALFVASWQLGPVSQYMFNAYCGSLDSFFAQMVSYGVLKEIDAQCFSIQGSIDPGSIALLVAAVLLALVNSVVTLASKQCLAEQEFERSLGSRESGSIEERQSDAKDGNRSNGSQTSGSSNEMVDETKIRPFPIMFSDAYRWLLTSEGSKKRSETISP